MATQRSKCAADVNNMFGLQLYNSITKGSVDNVFFSPLSITTALAMTYMGARGDTAKQMESVMKLTSLGNDVHHAFKDLNSELIPMSPSLQQTSPYQLKLANRLYGQKSFNFVPEFLAATRDLYNAQLEAVDFVSQTEDTRKAINSWVEEQTVGKIKDLLAPGVLTPDSRLVLVNALYFKGSWIEQFEEYNTKPMPFHISATNTVDVPMMFQQEKFMYYQDKSNRCQILAMKYEGHKVDMMVALPDDVDGLAKLETGLTADTLKSWRSNLRTAECRVTFPKFKFTKSFSLVDHLKQMGMSDLFRDDKADLSGIAKDPLVVSEVVHKAFLDVNEHGTEAAAATAVMMMLAGCMPGKPEVPKEFKADHPFLFFICDSSSGAVIFMGRVMKPVIE